MCRFCRESQESFIHLFADCPALWAERRDALGGFFTGGYLPTLTPKEMIDFSYNPRLKEALETEEETQRMWTDMEVLPSDNEEEDGMSRMSEDNEEEIQQQDREEMSEDEIERDND